MSMAAQNGAAAAAGFREAWEAGIQPEKKNRRPGANGVTIARLQSQYGSCPPKETTEKTTESTTEINT